MCGFLAAAWSLKHPKCFTLTRRSRRGTPYPASSFEGALPLCRILAAAWSLKHPKCFLPAFQKFSAAVSNNTIQSLSPSLQLQALFTTNKPQSCVSGGRNHPLHSKSQRRMLEKYAKENGFEIPSSLQTTITLEQIMKSRQGNLLYWFIAITPYSRSAY